MSLSKFFVKQSEELATKEIKSISKTVYGRKNVEIEKHAGEIVKKFLEINHLINPVTLARSSFYIALKTCDENHKGKIQEIKNNNGKTNQWWIHLVPVIEKQINDV